MYILASVARDPPSQYPIPPQAAHVGGRGGRGWGMWGWRSGMLGGGRKLLQRGNRVSAGRLVGEAFGMVRNAAHKEQSYGQLV